MNLRIFFTGKKGQSIFEYLILFVVLTAAAIFVFMGGEAFEPAANEEGKKDNFFKGLKIKDAFSSAVNKAITEINKQ